MIKLKVVRKKLDNSIMSFTVKGHAEFARKDDKYDIVCAAVSGIVYTALGYMDEYYNMNDFIEEDGYIKWDRPDGLSDKVINKINPVLEAMIIGIKQIEAKYAKNVSVFVEEV